MNFREYAKEFIVSSSSRLAPSTVAVYESALAGLEPFLGDKEIALIRKRDLELAATQLKIAGKQPERIKYLLQFAVMVLNDAQDNELRDKRLNQVKLGRVEPKKQRQPLTAREVAKVIDHVDPHFQPLFKFLFFTGCRPSEACGLKWSDIKSDVISISRGLVRGIEGVPKSSKGIRDIPITTSVRSVLDTVPKLHNEYLFVSKSVQPIDNSNLNRIWVAGCEKAKIDRIKSYALRHSFVSVAAKNGVDLAYISKHVGHSNINTTYKFYHSLFTGESEDRNRLERAFK